MEILCINSTVANNATIYHKKLRLQTFLDIQICIIAEVKSSDTAIQDNTESSNQILFATSIAEAIKDKIQLP
ncbi:MAG: hypothetical protein DI535_02245 [Citrobacter freundii]|nr:MAG: hypothetical protein DI535_02245 [Citrobacter freundii]